MNGSGYSGLLGYIETLGVYSLKWSLHLKVMDACFKLEHEKRETKTAI